MKGSHRSAAGFERRVRADLKARRWLRWHAFLLGLLCFATLWAVSAGLMHAGIETLALRWPLAFAFAYAAFIGLLWLWCRWLLSHDEFDADLNIDWNLDLPRLDLGRGGAPFRAGGGGDFGGGGASASFDGLPGADAASEVAQTALDAVASSDEGVVVAVPLAVVVGIALLIAGAIGFAVFGLFGIDVLLGVAVEIAFASAGGALAFRAQREGWLAHALSRTVWPAVALLLIFAVLGLVIDRWLPQAHSLPQALRLLHG